MTEEDRNGQIIEAIKSLLGKEQQSAILESA
jgi:hypothetical protein